MINSKAEVRNDAISESQPYPCDNPGKEKADILAHNRVVVDGDASNVSLCS